MIPSIFLLCVLSNLARHLRQYLWIDPDISTESKTERFNHLLRQDQTCFEYGQSLQRWPGVSGSLPQSLQIGSLVQLRLARLLAVRIFLCIKVQAKKRHLCSALALQIGINFNLLYPPSNWMRYALLVVYSPFDVHLQRIVSSLFSSNRTLLTSSQSATHSCISCGVCKGRI